MSCHEVGRIYRSLAGDILHAELHCLGECSTGGGCRVAKETSKVSYLTVEVQFCVCHDTAEIDGDICRLLLTTLKDGKKIVNVHAYCAGECPDAGPLGSICRQFTARFRGKYAEQDCEIEEIRCNCAKDF